MKNEKSKLAQGVYKTPSSPENVAIVVVYECFMIHKAEFQFKVNIPVNLFKPC